MLPGIWISVNKTVMSKRPFKNCNGFIRIRRFDDFISLFDHFDGVHPDQQFIFNN